MNTKDKLTHEVVTESCKRIAVIERYAQRIADLDTVCSDLDESAKALGIDANFVSLVTIHIDSMAAAAYTTDGISLMQMADIMDEAGYIYKFENPIHYTNEGQAIAFGVEGFQDQVIVANPVNHVIEPERLAA